MIFKLTDILRDVRICLDQNDDDGQLLSTGDIDTLTLDEIIRSKVEEAVRRVELAAPVYLLEEGHPFGDAVFWGSMESGWILLPNDFMRLVVFKMSDWEQAVYSAISPTDPIYKNQSSRYKGIRGNIQKPVCAIVNRPEGKVLEFYSCSSQNAYVSQANYIPYPHIDADDGIDISERCYTAVVYMIATLVCTTYGEANKASAFNELSLAILQQ